MLSLVLATVLLLLSTVLFLQRFRRPKNFPPGKSTLLCSTLVVFNLLC
jgi:hypothetical protein